MLQSSLILYARNEKTFYDRIILVGTYIFVDIPLVYSIQTYHATEHMSRYMYVYVCICAYSHAFRLRDSFRFRF